MTPLSGTRDARRIHWDGTRAASLCSATLPTESTPGTAHCRIAARRGPIEAIVAVEHALLIAIWHMLTNGAFNEDLGSDFSSRRNPDKVMQRALDQLEQRGYDVTLNPLPTAVAGWTFASEGS